MTLSIQSVSKQYRRDFWGLRGFSLELNTGVLGLLGSNGDGIVFDFGIDICECGIQEHYRAKNAGDNTPYVCHLGHAVGKMLELGFNRQDPLVNSAAVCDCRWKLGTETPGWPPIPYTVLHNSNSKMEVSI